MPAPRRSTRRPPSKRLQSPAVYTSVAPRMESKSTGDAPAYEVFEQGLLCMQPVFGLVPHHTLWTVDDVRSDFLAAMRGQAVHEQRIRPRVAHHVRRNLPVAEGALAHLVLRLESHARPHVRRHEVGAVACCMRIVERDAALRVAARYRH